MNRFCRLITCTTLLVSLTATTALAQSSRTEHTYRLDDPANRPAASLADVSWLVGSWAGEAFGGEFEEVWNPPSAGSMVGMFKVLQGDEVSFYELMLLIKDGDSLNLLVKHFSEDFSAWEDKQEHVTFRLVKIEKDAIHFSGLSFYRINPNEIHAYIVLKSGEKSREEKLVYCRN